MGFDAATIDRARRHIRRRDLVMRRLIDRVGPFTLRPKRGGFRMLARSIIAQQISGKAAVSIYRRLETLAGERGISAAWLRGLGAERLRRIGISPQKARYLKDLAEKVLTGEVRVARLAGLTDEQVISELTQVKGIGRWTAQMYLIFALGRLDVFPHDDLGVRLALQELYRLPDLPDEPTSTRIARPWRPFATVATWYCWRSRDPLLSQVAPGTKRA